MTRTVYRIGTFLPFFGISGVLFFSYFALYSSGYITWKLIPWQSDPDPAFVDNPGGILLCVLFGVGSLVLIGALRLRVTVDESGILYQGLIRSKYMRWVDVLRVNIYIRDTNIHLWTRQSHMTLTTMFSRRSDLRPTIAQLVKLNNPDAVVENYRHPFWPRKQ